MKVKDLNLRKEIFSFLIAFAGFLLLAVSINIFSWQYRLVSGGFPGFGLYLSYVSGYPVGQILLILNIIILALLFIYGGAALGIKSALGYFLFPVLVDFTRVLMRLSQYPGSTFLFSVLMITLQAVVAGCSVALFFSREYSSGGWGALAFVVKKYFKIPGPKFLLAMDILLTIFVTLTMDLSAGILLGINSFVFYYAFRYSLNFFEHRP